MITYDFETWPDKDPGENQDYQFDWLTDGRLNADETISTSTWAVTNATKGVTSKTNTVTTVWISGGTLGKTVEAVNTIVTSQGRTMVRTGVFNIARQ